MALAIKDGNNVDKSLKTTLDGSDEVTHHIIDNFPSGQATSANQATEIAALASILAKIIAAPSTSAKQDDIITAINAIPGGGGDATAANQATGNASLASILTKIIAAPAGAASKTHLVSAATTNATIVKASAGRLVGWRITNTNAAFRYVKLHNIATTPTAGSGVVETIGAPPSSSINGFFVAGSAFTTGIGMTTVTEAIYAGTTAVGAGDLIIDLFFA